MKHKCINYRDKLDKMDMIRKFEKEELLRGSTPTFAKLYAKGFYLGLEDGYGYCLSDIYAVAYMTAHINVYFKGFTEEDCVTSFEQFIEEHPNKIFMISEFMIEWLMFYKIYAAVFNPDLDVTGIPLTNNQPAANVSDREKRMRIFLTSFDDPDYREWLCKVLNIFSKSKIYYKAVQDLSKLNDLVDYKLSLKIVCNLIKQDALTLEQLADVSGYNLYELKNIKRFLSERDD